MDAPTKTPENKILETDIRSCARCDGDHDAMKFQPFTRPAFVGATGEVYASHWAPCPVTGEPLLLEILELKASSTKAA